MLRTRSDSDRHRDCHLSLSESQHNQHIGVIYKDQESGIRNQELGIRNQELGGHPVRIRIIEKVRFTTLAWKKYLGSNLHRLARALYILAYL